MYGSDCNVFSLQTAVDILHGVRGNGLRFQLRHLGGVDCKICVVLPTTVMEPTTENYQLKWHSFSSHLYGCVANYYNSESFSDVHLFTMDGHQIAAHRLVLSTCSQYFHQVLKVHHKLPTTFPLLIVLPPEINYRTMKILTQYMYTGETTVSKDILENVLRGGDLLKIQGLWRPREEGQHSRKLVKVHQKSDLLQNTNDTLKQQSPSQKQQQQQQISPSQLSKENKTPNSKKIEAKQKENDNESDDNGDRAESVNSDKVSASLENVEEQSVDEATSNEKLQFLVIKEEPLEWNEVNECEMELIEDGEVFDTEMTIKPEIVLEDRDETKPSEEIYSPLTCELCAETFSLPADWVKHIQSHTDMMPAKRQRRGRASNDEEQGSFPPLHCDMCQKYFPTPAEWVHHIQNTHTEFELRLSNKTTPARPVRINRQIGPSHKVCTLCNKKFPSHASMLIHKRTHTGEKPYMCEYCYKGFNVKSNLLRHLRTLHDRIINSTEIESKEILTISEKNNDS
ncbi:btb domain transcription factor [Holotrichia oblita]|uniref:Btb domain transcription factor n=1 Tax=Holotrichia oblita TaxID=644536 RepID=A0ACB9TLZ9_HOLOL|nr:btb domain transcription factor [Holotrichia oblita]